MDNRTVKDAEKVLLGALIADPTMFHIVDGLVDAESFYTTKHQLLYTAIERLVKDDAPVDVTTLRNVLNGKIDTSELLNISASQPTGGNAEYYANLVADKRTRRVAITSMRSAIEQMESNADTVDVVATVQKELDATLPQMAGQSDVYPDIIKTMERVIDTEAGANYLPTGFGKIDRHASLRPGNLTLIAADPGAGKTSYLLCCARHIAKHGKRPLIFTLEMTREQILENIIAQELRICHQDMINGRLTDAQVKLMTSRAQEFDRLNMGIIGGHGWTSGKIRHRAITEARTKGLDCLMIDSLTKVKLPTDAGRYTNKLTDVYNLILGEMVDIADELNIPVVITHHLNKDSSRRGENNKPTVHSLREAGDMWTHNVILIHREYLHTKDEAVENDAEFIIGKARDGKVGIVKAWFDGPTKTFGEVADEYDTTG